jgi:phospholipid/cholesterol/gamma-HCH transport system substrate-binding protein
MKNSKEIKVGLLAIVALVMFYFGFNFLKGSDLFSRTNRYYITYDNVDGLAESNPVLLNGFSVGRVHSIQILGDKGYKLLVAVDVRRDVALYQGSKATLADGGLLGGKVIRLDLAPSGALLPSGDTLTANVEAGISALLQEKALPVITHADSLVRTLTTVTSGFKETSTILNAMLKNYDQTGLVLRGTLEGNKANITALTNNLKQLTASLVETEKGIKPLLAKAESFTDSLNALELGRTVATANQAVAQLQGLLSALQQGQGTAGKLMNDDKLYNNLNYSLISLNQLLANFREQPKRYVNVSVFGRKDRGPSESPVDTTLQFKPQE